VAHGTLWYPSGPMTDLEDDDEPKKTPRATIIRRGLVFALALACAGGWAYTRWGVDKHALGETCTYDLHCRTEAPRCLKQSAVVDGVCSRSCETDADCAPGIRCVKVELEDRDERGRPLEGGYCFPQAILDARKKKKPDAGPPPDSWIAVPETAGQLEGEIVLERGATKASYEIKGTLLRHATGEHRRAIVDTSSLRLYTVDDDRKTFAASQLPATDAEVKVTKTERKDSVAGRECEIWEVAESAKDARLLEACVVRGGAFVDPEAKRIAPWEKELAVRGVFPLRVGPAGKPEAKLWSAAKVELHPVDAALFSIPKAYKNLAARP